jgi:hypothetical protein
MSGKVLKELAPAKRITLFTDIETRWLTVFPSGAKLV